MLPSSMSPSSKAKAVEYITTHDVVFGRGRGYEKHPGNVRFHEILESYMDQYMAAKTRAQKVAISVSIISSVSMSGRFLRYDSTPQGWVPAHGDSVCNKVSQALRHRARIKKKEAQYEKTCRATLNCHKSLADRQTNVMPEIFECSRPGIESPSNNRAKLVEHQHGLSPIPFHDSATIDTIGLDQVTFDDVDLLNRILFNRTPCSTNFEFQASRDFPPSWYPTIKSKQHSNVWRHDNFSYSVAMDPSEIRARCMFGCDFNSFCHKPITQLSIMTEDMNSCSHLQTLQHQQAFPDLNPELKLQTKERLRSPSSSIEEHEIHCHPKLGDHPAEVELTSIEEDLDELFQESWNLFDFDSCL